MSRLLFKRLATLVMVLAVCLPVGVAFAATPAQPSAASAAERPLAPGNSQANSTVLDATNLAPGDSRSATVTITNRDRAPASFALSMAGLREQPGRGGGKLSTKLLLRVEDLSGGRAPATVYGGTLHSMSRQMLGTFAAGESRTYRFHVTFPDGEANAYMGGSVSLDFHWRANR